MNTKAFAVAAVFGASAALAYECPEAAALPGNFNDLSWRAQAGAKFNYMDNCPKDGMLSYRELVRYSGEVPMGLHQAEDPSSDRDQVFYAMMRMDDNSNSIIEFPEYLRREQTVAEPITESNDEDEKFDYLSCKPQFHENGEYHNCRESYDRSDLRQTIWMFENVDHIVDSVHTPNNESILAAYEVYINKEFRHRDYNSDGKIEKEEHDRHRMHKQAVKENFDDLVDLTDENKISRPAYVSQGDGHPWLHYYDAQVAFDKMDTNYDQMLSFDEAWDAAQIDDIIWRKFDEIYQRVDLDDDQKVTQFEILAYVAGDFEGAMTAEQIEERAIEFFHKYNTSSAEHEGEQVVTKDEAWRVVSAVDHAREKDDKEERDLHYVSKQGWMSFDADHDDILLAQDLTGAVDQVTLVELYKLLGKNTVTDALRWEDVKNGFVLKEFYGFRQLQRDWMAAIHDDTPSYTFSYADIDNDEARAHFGETREELERVFNLADTNNDGLVDGDEACRWWVGDSDLMCLKFAPEYSDNWLSMIEEWVRNPLAH